MEGLLTFLIFAGFFYFMMRFGCGAHAVHGHHGGHGDGKRDGAELKDPVCGMKVEPGHGYARAYEGREYRFCSRNCLDRFDLAPEHYTEEKGARQ